MSKESLEDKEPVKEIDDSPEEINLMEDFKPIGELGGINAELPPRGMLLTYQESTKKDSPKEEELDFLPTGIVGMVVATGGIGKTYLLADLAVSVVTGKQWLSHFDVVGDNLRVALILGEEDKEEIIRRVKRVALEEGKELNKKPTEAINKNLYILPMKGKSGKFTTDEKNSEWYTQLIEKLKIEPFDLIIFDPAAQFMADKSEIDNFSGTQFIKKLEKIINLHKDHKTTVLVAHHTSQSNVKANHQHSGRGSTALSDGSRWILNLGQIRGKQKTTEKDIPSWDINILEEYVGFHHVKSSYTKKHPYAVIKKQDKGEGEFEKLVVKEGNGWSEFLIKYDSSKKKRIENNPPSTEYEPWE